MNYDAGRRLVWWSMSGVDPERVEDSLVKTAYHHASVSVSPWNSDYGVSRRWEAARRHRTLVIINMDRESGNIVVGMLMLSCLL